MKERVNNREMNKKCVENKRNKRKNTWKMELNRTIEKEEGKKENVEQEEDYNEKEDVGMQSERRKRRRK